MNDSGLMNVMVNDELKIVLEKLHGFFKYVDYVLWFLEDCWYKE